MKKIIIFPAIVLLFTTPICFATENTGDNATSPIENNQSTTTPNDKTIKNDTNMPEISENTEDQDRTKNESTHRNTSSENRYREFNRKNDYKEGNDEKYKRREKNYWEDGEEFLAPLVGILSGLIGLALGASGTVLYFRRKRQK
ncbi:hypothetical protein IPN35_03035 [Candidatus Peregrinibacteria bacterium]|nr:MAG: hypothetical protein IPN35_03035 [Candidatus Peregrinibacteria bacterium]